MKKVTTNGKKLPKKSTSEGQIAKAEMAQLLPMGDLGELPRSYGTDSIFLVAQEPHWLFTYWDIDISRHPGGKTFLRVLGNGDRTETEIEVPFETRNWYIPVGVAGGHYTVEIGYYRGDAWNVLARSMTVRTPTDKVSDSEAFDFATIPLHLSFQKLMENMQSAIRGGENLLQALGRLQRDGKLLGFGGGEALGGISPDERVVLEAHLGRPFLEELASAGLNSEELSSRIQERLRERLSSEGASDLLAGSSWTPENLSSALGSFGVASESGALSSGGLSSWSPAALSSWAAAALTSWVAAVRTSAESGETSWSNAAPSSWDTAALSSWMQAAKPAGAQSSWSPAALSSWLQAVTSSWAGAAPSSWSQAVLSSWTQAAQSSWGAAETSSWGGSQGMSSFDLAAKREFFLHVNAEVIFYGGTHPQAKVTIDGKPVALAPDGSFRFHFVFPDGAYEIPICATSPDGVETRSATLRFERETQRSGEVGHTAQPPLASPMGAH